MAIGRVGILVQYFKHISRNVGLVIILLAFAATGVGYLLVRQDIEKIRISNKEELLWPAVQIELELLRFQLALKERTLPNDTVDPRLVNVRFDILWSEVSLFEHGTVGARLRFYDRKDGAMAALLSKMNEIEPLVVKLKPGDLDSIKKIQISLQPFNERLRHLSRTVMLGESDAKSERRTNLGQSSYILMLLSLIAMSCSLILVVFFARDTARHRENSARIMELLNKTKDAAKSKSRFLAMVSHDLRTPMNGVLGILALVRQGGLSDAQIRLMERAESSGGQMIALLEDVLDYSALQDEQLSLENKPFEPKKLAEAISERFQPVAIRQGTGFSVSVTEPVPRRVFGDFTRIRQALIHIATYIVETAGTKNIALELGYDKGHLTISIVFAYSKPGVEWNPELIMGEPAGRDQILASEALGPTVSRGLIDKMGGTTRLNNRGDNAIEVVVSVPAEVLIVDTLLIGIVCKSAALEIICRVAMRGDNVEFVDANPVNEKDQSYPKDVPHVIVLEAGGENEAENVRSVSESYPAAIIVALGIPVNPRLFDDRIAVPIDVTAVHQSSFMRLAADGRLAEKSKLRYAEEISST